MTWCSQISPFPRSSRPWEWTTTSGCKPSSTMKSWRGSGDRNQVILINDSCGESSGWGFVRPLYPKLSTCFEGAWLTQLVQLVTAGRLFPCHKGQVDLSNRWVPLSLCMLWSWWILTPSKPSSCRNGLEWEENGCDAEDTQNSHLSWP